MEIITVNVSLRIIILLYRAVITKNKKLYLILIIGIF